jgi:hypothetical protein
MPFAVAEYAGKRKQARCERFLIEMDQVMPWKGLITVIKPHHPKGGAVSGISVDGHEEAYVCGDAGCVGVEKRPERQNRTMIWSIAARPGTYEKYAKRFYR